MFSSQGQKKGHVWVFATFGTQRKVRRDLVRKDKHFSFFGVFSPAVVECAGRDPAL